MTHHCSPPSARRRSHSRRRWLRLVIGCLSLWFGLPTLALAELQVQMSADRNSVELGGQIVLQIQVSTPSLDRPDITLPEFHGFEVVQQSVQRPTHFSFGMGGQQVRSSVHYTFVLSATQEGKIVIEPVVAVLGKTRARSQQLTIEVIKTGSAPQTTLSGSPQQPAAAPTASPSDGPAPQVEQTENYVHAQQVDPEAFIRTVIDKAEPYEREQATVTLYLYTRERLQVAPTIDQEASTDGFWTQDLLDGKALERLPSQRVGRVRYNVYLLRRMAAFPLRSGELTVGAMRLTIQRPQNLFNIFGRQGRPAAPLERSGVPITLNVRPLPEEGKPKGDVAVGNYEVAASLDRTQTATGDAVTLTATIKGRGHIQSVRLPTPKRKGLQVLEPQIRDLVEIDQDRVGGTRVFEWLVVPQQPGTYELPPFAIHTFDPENGTYAEVESGAISLTAAGRAVAELPPANQGTAGPAPTATDGGDVTLPNFGPVRTHSALLRKQSPLHKQPLFPLALLLPPLAFAGLWLKDRLAHRAQHRKVSSSEQALAAAEQHMAQADRAAARGDSADFHAELASALLKVTESRMDEPLGGFTRTELQRHLQRHGMAEDLTRALVKQLERCDQARFSAMTGSSTDLQLEMQNAQELYDQLQRFQRTQAEEVA